MRHLFLLILISTFLMQCNMGENTKDTIKNQEEREKKIIQRNLYLNELLNKKNLVPGPGSDAQSSTTPATQSIKINKEPYKILEGTKIINAFVKNIIIKWTKNVPLSIKGRDGNPIKELEGKIKYCYSITPITKNQQFTNETMPVVLFQTVQNGGENLRVDQLHLEDNPEIDLNTRYYAWYYNVPKTEASREPGYLTINPFWVQKKNTAVIQALTQNEYIKAKISVVYEKKEKDTTQKKTKKTTKEYKILLDSTYLVQLIKDTLAKYPNIRNYAKDFKL